MLTERESFIRVWESGLFTMTELCEQFRVSRRTGHKWVDRYRREGLAGLKDQSRAPHTCPHRTLPEIEAAIIALKHEKRRWGPKKIHDELCRRRPETTWPAISTMGEVLSRAGLVERRTNRRRVVPPSRPISEASTANEVWSIDFKGEFRLGGGSLCYPLTIQDRWSRYILACTALSSTATDGVRAAIERAFREHGLPDRIRSDNGTPFASTSLVGLTRLNAWWMELGIEHERTAKGRPDQNGAHERMHRELKAETSFPPATDSRGQQRLFDQFRLEYNHDRPHEGIGQQRPADIWSPSKSRFPDHELKPEYPGHFETRMVKLGGEIKFKGRTTFLAQALAGKQIGLEPVSLGLWSIYFFATFLGRYDESTGQVSG